MSYRAEPTFQIYGNQRFLTHNIKGEGEDDDRHLFAQRMTGYGIFSFGALTSGQAKRVVLADVNIVSPISLVSVYAFGVNAANDEIRFRLFAGTVQIAEQIITKNEMPFQYPKGAVIDPSLSIEVEADSRVTQLMMYWQPVHVIDYIEVN